jgi:hypothetical protein
MENKKNSKSLEFCIDVHSEMATEIVLNAMEFVSKIK